MYISGVLFGPINNSKKFNKIVYTMNYALLPEYSVCEVVKLWNFGYISRQFEKL